MLEKKTDKYDQLLDKVSDVLEKARSNSYALLNEQMIKTYWQIGQYIIDFEQLGNIKAEYGKQLMDKLSKDLTTKYGKGFSRSNLFNIRLLYVRYPEIEKISTKLTWSHYIELISITDDMERNFYEIQTINENWKVRELKRQMDTALFQRLALSKDKNEILELSQKGKQIRTDKDLIQTPYVFEFLGLPETNLYTENQLEKRLIDNLQKFLLELGKGFAFVDRQYRITLDNEHYFVDLVFYHYILKCFVIIDLKVRKVKHLDIGQMVLYLNYFAKEVNKADDNEPIGIILTAEKNDIMVEYATASLTNKLTVAKYQLYLPDKKLLQEKVRQIIENE